MFDKIAKIWADTEAKLPGFRYFTAAFLILIVLGYLILNYVNKDYWWTVIPGFLLILLFTLFVWLVLTLINPPSGPEGITRGMRIFLMRFVVFLFVGFVVAIIGLSATLALWQQPAVLCRELGCPPPPTPPDERSVQLAHMILRSRISADWRLKHPRYEGVFQDSVGMDGLLGDLGCEYCKLNDYQSPCPPEYTATLCFISTKAIAAARQNVAAAPPHIERNDGGCESKKLTQVRAPDRILGIDLSHIDHDVDFKTLQQKGVYFVYLKASQGAHFIDAAFSKRWKAAGEAGMIRGAYHTFTDESPRSQAALFLSALGQVEYGPCDLGPALDLGIAQNLAPPYAPEGTLKIFVEHAGIWLATVRAGMGEHVPIPIVYLIAGPFQKDDSSVRALANYPLWFGSYAVIGHPSPPAAWKQYVMRQFTDGRAGEVIDGLPYDTNEFNGSVSDLIRMTR
jgi:lysozyme